MRIKKSTLWTLLVIILIVFFFLFFNPLKSSVSAGAINQSIFTSNPDLYPSLGPDNAKNVVIEFSDFQCPICGIASGFPSWSSQYSSQTEYNAAGQIEQSAKQGNLKFVSVTMSFLGQGSVYAAEAAFCANDQGQFWAMHDIIYSNQVPPSQEGTQFTKSQLETMAQGIQGLDQTKFKNCLESDTNSLKVQASETTAMSLVQGTPTFFVNGNPVQPSWAAIQAALK